MTTIASILKDQIGTEYWVFFDTHDTTHPTLMIHHRDLKAIASKCGYELTKIDIHGGKHQ